MSNDPARIGETAAWAEIVVLAAPFGAIDDVLKNVGDTLSGKTVVDVANALDSQMNLAVGFTTSGAEDLKRKIPAADVVKAFNTVFGQHMESGKLGDTSLTAFVAGDNADAKASVQDLVRRSA